MCWWRAASSPATASRRKPKNRCRRLVLYLATVRAGAVYLPLNTAYTLNELEYFIADAEPSLVVCDPSKAEGIGAIAAKVGAKVETLGADGKGSLTDAAAKARRGIRDRRRAPTTISPRSSTRRAPPGRSKGAMLTHDNLASNSLTLVDYWRFTDKDVLIHALPIYHTHGLFVASNVTLFARASMIFLPKFDPELIIKLMARATVLMGVPTFYTRLLQSPALTQGIDQAHAAVHFRLGAAARRHPSRMVCAHRPRRARALRHDRNQHEHLQPL